MTQPAKLRRGSKTEVKANYESLQKEQQSYFVSLSEDAGRRKIQTVEDIREAKLTVVAAGEN